MSATAAPERLTPEEIIARLFQEPVREEWFADSFLAQVPIAQVSAIVDGFKQKWGAVTAVTGGEGRYLATLEQAEIPFTITLDDQGRIVGLFAGEAVPVKSIDELADVIRDLPGQSALLVISDGRTRIEHRADEPLAVGSAFKLAILAALDDAVTAGRLRWDQVVALDPKWRTTPSSMLIGWPAGSPVTIASLANLMISVSDNMATDALVDLVGRAPIEAITPRNTPFLKTAETFKLASNPEDLAAWSKADEAGRRAILNRLETMPLPGGGQPASFATQAEWFISARELCALLDRVAHLPAMTINPGPADAERWQAVAFKGGSDDGVLNYSTRLAGKDGKVHCVIATWNDGKPLHDETLRSAYRGILRGLAAGG